MRKSLVLFGILLILLSACGAKASSSPITAVSAAQTPTVQIVMAETNKTETINAPANTQKPIETLVTPLNLSDPESIVYWLAYDMAHGQTDAFNQVITSDTLLYGTGMAGGRDPIDKSLFLVELEQRMKNRPTCVGYDINDEKNSIMLWTNNWNTLWDFRGEPTSEEMTFHIFLHDGQIEMWAYFTPASTILDLPTVRHKPCPVVSQ